MMKKLFLILSLFLLGSSPGFIPTAQAATCGQWTDVPEEYRSALTEVCEAGLIQGYSESTFGFYDPLLRAQAAVLAARMTVGEAALAQFSTYEFSYTQLTLYFTDLPELSETTEWMMGGIFYSNQSGVMTGDGSGVYPTTFRPMDTISVPETFKVFWEAGKEAGLLNTEFTEISYSGYPWYGQLMQTLEAESVFLNLDLAKGTFWLPQPTPTPIVNFGSVTRGQAALFLYSMLESGVIVSD